VPYRHGGVQTVATCRECHSLKDRCRPVGIADDWSVESSVFASVLKGLSSVPTKMHVLYPDGADEVPISAFLIAEIVQEYATLEPEEAWRIAYGSIDAIADRLVAEVRECSTPEARIWLAQSFAIALDMLDERLGSRAFRRAHHGGCA
jgi:hypothetical protein